jgi:hypothetical protein
VGWGEDFARGGGECFDVEGFLCGELRSLSDFLREIWGCGLLMLDELCLFLRGGLMSGESCFFLRGGLISGDSCLFLRGGLISGEPCLTFRGGLTSSLRWRGELKESCSCPFTSADFLFLRDFDSLRGGLRSSR